MSAIGTALGGVLIAGFGWRTLFLVNVPQGIDRRWTHRHGGRFQRSFNIAGDARYPELQKVIHPVSAMAVEVRFPGMTADEDDAEESVSATVAICDVVRVVLGCGRINYTPLEF